MKVKDHQKIPRFLPDCMIKKSINKGKYTCFADFFETYESIKRDLLFKKLYKTNVSGNILQVIMSMYSSTISSKAFGEKHSEAIKQ